MAFEEQLPQWENEGTQPPQSKRVEGWLPNEKPPASWFNWLFGRTYKVLQELQQKAETKTGAQAKADAAEQAANLYTDQRIGEVEDDIKTPDPSYTPDRPIDKPGDMTRDMQKQFITHLDDYEQLKDDLKLEFARLRNTAIQSIPSDEWTSLVFNEVYAGNNQFWDSNNPSQLKTLGYKKIKLHAQIQFAGNQVKSDGVFRVRFDLDGANSPAYGGSAFNLITDNPVLCSVQSPIIDVEGSEYVEVKVHQNTGSSMNTASFSVFFQIEVVEK